MTDRAPKLDYARPGRKRLRIWVAFAIAGGLLGFYVVLLCYLYGDGSWFLNFHWLGR